MERRNKILRFTAYGLEILIFYIVQGMPNLIPRIFGGGPLLLLPVAITIACFENEVSAMFFGLACGAMMDFGTGVRFGFYTFALLIVCFFLGYFSENYFNTRLVMVIIISLILVPLLVSGDFLFSYIIKGYGHCGSYFVRHSLSTMACTFVTTPVFYGINRTLSRGFREY